MKTKNEPKREPKHEPKTKVHNSVRKLRIEADDLPQRLDNFLYKTLSGVPLTRIYRAIRKGEVRINGRRIKPSYKLQAADELRIPPFVEKAPVLAPKSEPGKLQRLRNMLLLQRDGLMVFNKPPGWAVHGGSGISAGFIETARQAFGDERLLELAHRLDRDTSGCLLVATKRSVLRELHTAFRHGKVAKEYLCVVAGGDWPEGRLSINAPLRKIILANGERRAVADTSGAASRTKFERLAASRDFSLLRALPATGRMHQIRVHARHHGQPVVGDDKYGDDAANKRAAKLGFKGMALHAAALSFELGGERIAVEAPLPGALATFLRRQGWDAFCEQSS